MGAGYKCELCSDNATLFFLPEALKSMILSFLYFAEPEISQCRQAVRDWERFLSAALSGSACAYDCLV